MPSYSEGFYSVPEAEYDALTKRVAELKAALAELYSATKNLDDDAAVHEWETLTLAVGNAKEVLEKGDTGTDEPYESLRGSKATGGGDGG